MRTINTLSPSPELKRRVAAAFPGVLLDAADITKLFQRGPLTPQQEDVKKEVEQLIIETQEQ